MGRVFIILKGQNPKIRSNKNNQIIEIIERGFLKCEICDIMKVVMVMKLDTLNEKQREAVVTTEGPLLVLAGAGSGKTKVLTTRIAYLIDEVGIDPYHILAITFTNKAAKEMKERVVQMLGPVGNQIQISTFHSFGLTILRENYEAAGLKSNFTIIDSDDTLSVIKKIMKDLNLDIKEYNPKAIRNKISGAKNELLTAHDYERFANTDFEDKVVQVYQRYEQRLASNNSVDFDDLLMKPILLFRKNPMILQKYQERFQYVLVDEYQDTNEAQYILTKMISAKYKNICVVGDNDQCLIATTKVTTRRGQRRIDQLTTNDSVLCGCGKGYTNFFKVDKISHRHYEGKVIRVKTKSGKMIKATPNHIVFYKLNHCFEKQYIYLALHPLIGWIVGRTKSFMKEKDRITNCFCVRINGVNSTKSWVVETCSSRAEAIEREKYYSKKYNIPLAPFFSRGKNLVIPQKELDEIKMPDNIEENVERLMHDRHLFMDYPHDHASLELRNDLEKRILNLNFFDSQMKGARDYYSHRIYINTTGMDNYKKLAKLGYPVNMVGGDTIKIQTVRNRYEDVLEYIKPIQNLFDDLQVISKIRLNMNKVFNFMPIGSLRVGMVIATMDHDEVIDDEIIEVKEMNYKGEVYDLSIPEMRNYVANGVFVHNCIYSWRGSNYRNILNFEKDYDHPKVILLEENYRSTSTILNAANDVIKNNKQRKDKNLWTHNEDGVKIKYHRSLDEKEEAYYVAKEIDSLIHEGVSKDEIAVLYRTNAQSRNMEEALLRENIPYKVIGSFYFYNRKEIKDLMSYLKLIYNPYDDTSLLRAINTPKRGIGLRTLSKLQEKATLHNQSLYEAIESGRELEFKKIIEALKEKQETSSLTELVEAVLDFSGMRKELESEKSIEAEVRLENLEEFKSITKSFEEEHGIISLGEFLSEISLVSDIEEHKNNEDVVTLMTTHSAKGLEFDYVFLIGVEEGILPHTNSLMDQEELEEERRLCYVAITRAKKRLWLLNAKRRTLYGMDSYNPPSRFISEIDPKYIDSDEEETTVDHLFNKPVQNISTEIDYGVGDHVIHDTFGTGVVVSMDKSIVTIAFAHPIGIKKILKGHKSIRKG